VRRQRQAGTGRQEQAVNNRQGGTGRQGEAGRHRQAGADWLV